MAGLPEKFVYVLNEFPSISQTFVTNEILAIRETGVAVQVISTRRGAAVGPDGLEHLVLAELPVLKVASSWIRLALKRPLSLFKLLAEVARVGPSGRLIALFAPFVVLETGMNSSVHLHTHFASRSCLLARVLAHSTGASRSVTTHAADIYGDNQHLEAQLAGAACATISRFNQALLFAKGFPDVRLIHCGVATAPVGTKRTGKVGLRAPNLVTIGRLVEKKGHATTIAALADHRLNSAKLTIVGDGPLLAQLRSQADEVAPGRVTFTGSIGQGEAMRVLESADCFVLACQVTSEGDMDGIPVAFLEAAARHIPVVGSVVGGVSEFLSEETGWVARTGDSTDLARSVAAALQDPSESERRAAAAFIVVETEFSVMAQASETMALAAGSRTETASSL